MPLSVEYREKTAAAGRIPKNFLSRDLQPSENEILKGRMIDRSLRPLFPKGFSCETQVVCNLLSVDGICNPDILAINAASTALAVSDVPWEGPVAAVRVGFIDKKFVINPPRLEQLKSDLNLVVSCTERKEVVMIEASAEQISTDTFKAAIQYGVKHAQVIIQEIKSLQKSAGKEKRAHEATTNISENAINLSTPIITKVKEILQDTTHHKVSRDIALLNAKKDLAFKLSNQFPDKEAQVFFEAIDVHIKNVFRDLILTTGYRCDGRTIDQIRPVSCEVDLYNPLHGSALFQRGQTQVLCTCTFDSLVSVAKVDEVSILTGGLKKKNFMLHYEFPGYAINEVDKPGLTRRERGHGALAERGIRPVIPKDFPFAIRLTSEVLESNGSSSMASVCGGCLALMDAGVKIDNPVAGVAIGLITKADPYDETEISKYKILTDLMGIEDHFGDMDFKMAGTKTGVTALQADVKLPGVPIDIMLEAVDSGTVAIDKMLSIMAKTISAPREERKKCGPVTETIVIPASERSKLIGVGGYNLKKIRSETGVQIEATDELKFEIFAPNPSALEEAKRLIEESTKAEPEPELVYGSIYSSIIEKIQNNGVLVRLHEKIPLALLPNSQLDKTNVSHPSVLGLEVGQKLMVKYYGLDPVKGTMRISRKVIQTASTSGAKDLNKK